MLWRMVKMVARGGPDGCPPSPTASLKGGPNRDRPTRRGFVDDRLRPGGQTTHLQCVGSCHLIGANHVYSVDSSPNHSSRDLASGDHGKNAKLVTRPDLDIEICH